MDSSQPPLLIESPASASPPAVSRKRWWVHLLVLVLFPIVVGALSSGTVRDKASPILPTTTSGLLLMVAMEVCLFTFLFGSACYVSRATGAQLLLKWEGGLKPVLWGLLYSVGLRIAVAVIVLVIVIVSFVFKGADATTANALRPQVENLLNVDALVRDPFYLLVTLTLVSFVVAGLREELWRAGVLAGLLALFPQRFEGWKGKVLAVSLVSVLFGLGHIPQGFGGVLATTVLGFGLGMIMVWHRSIWPAVLAHGFFDATTFFLLFVLMKYFAPLFSKILHGG